ncbi:MAG: universal stress protein [candidate division Zixibacteria bacterium]|nr:universal stress protein [Candidatus Tariuqbacter arcticus]
MYKRIVCPVDLSQRSFKSLPIAVKMADTFKAKLIVLHIVETFLSEQETIMLRVSSEHYQQVQKQKALEVKDTINQNLDKLGISSDNIDIVLREGSPRHDIADLSKKLGADLIILTTTGRDHLMENIIGSTAEAVLRRAKVSVMTVFADDLA